MQAAVTGRRLLTAVATGDSRQIVIRVWRLVTAVATGDSRRSIERDWRLVTAASNVQLARRLVTAVAPSDSRRRVRPLRRLVTAPSTGARREDVEVHGRLVTAEVIAIASQIIAHMPPMVKPPHEISPHQSVTITHKGPVHTKSLGMGRMAADTLGRSRILVQRVAPSTTSNAIRV